MYVGAGSKKKWLVILCRTLVEQNGISREILTLKVRRTSFYNEYLFSLHIQLTNILSLSSFNAWFAAFCRIPRGRTNVLFCQRLRINMYSQRANIHTETSRKSLVHVCFLMLLYNNCVRDYYFSPTSQHRITSAVVFRECLRISYCDGKSE